MSTKPKDSFTDSQLATFSKWLKSKFSNPAVIYSAANLGELYKRSLLKWLVSAPAKVQKAMDNRLDAVLQSICGYDVDNFGRVRRANEHSPVNKYLQALVEKYIEDHEAEIRDRAFPHFERMIVNADYDSYQIKSTISKCIERIVEKQLEDYFKILNNEFGEQVRKQIEQAFAEIREDVDLANPKSMESVWGKVMAELRLMEGDM
jgi:hypothetical protein